MTERRATDVLGSLPHSRPHRRSDKRRARPPGSQEASPNGAEQSAGAPARPSSATTSPAPAPRAAKTPSARTAKPAGARTASPPSSPADRDERPARRAVLGTAVQVAAELTEIGLTLGARALRRAAARLPRP